MRLISFLQRSTVWRCFTSPHQTSAVSELSPDNHIKISCLMDWCMNEQSRTKMEKQALKWKHTHGHTYTHTDSTRLNRGEELTFPPFPFVADWILKCTLSSPGAHWFELLHIRVYSALEPPAGCNLTLVCPWTCTSVCLCGAIKQRTSESLQTHTLVNCRAAGRFIFLCVFPQLII